MNLKKSHYPKTPNNVRIIDILHGMDGYGRPAGQHQALDTSTSTAVRMFDILHGNWHDTRYRVFWNAPAGQPAVIPSDPYPL